MRLGTLVLCLMILGAVAPLAAPTASACAGDPSVCGVLRDARCIQREGATSADECVRWLP